MTPLLRRALIVVPPLALAGVLLIHPNDEGDTIYASIQPTDQASSAGLKRWATNQGTQGT